MSATLATARRSWRISGEPDYPLAREPVDLGATEAEPAQHFGGVLTQVRSWAAQSARCRREAGDHIVHRQLPHLGVGKVDQDLARDHMGVGHELVDVVNRSRS